jgi:hypothetical protein
LSRPRQGPTELACFSLSLHYKGFHERVYWFSNG